MTTVLIQALEPLWFVLQLFLLWLAADFITGVVHWWQDAYGNPKWPIIGKFVIEPNLIHHQNPRHMLQGNYWYRVNTSVFTAVILSVTFWLLGWHSWQMVVCLMFCSQGNEIHAMGHRTDKENGKFICALQKIGIIQTRRTHGWHHKAPYDTNFCVMTEFLNPALNWIGFWNKVEWSLQKFFKIKVLRGSAVRQGI